MDKNINNLKHFGAMIDCSRNAVKTVDEVKRFISNISKMGYNTLELYCEDTYKIDGEPYFGYLRGGYSIDEIKEIDKFAKSKGVELIPCIQTLAHFDCLLTLPQYSKIRDINNILLIDEPSTYELIDKLFNFCSQAFTSREINIGFDEAFLVGLGKYLTKNGYKNKTEILQRHLAKVIDIATKYGFKAHMWSDMFFSMVKREDNSIDSDYYCDKVIKFPSSIIDKIPKNVSLVYWDYYNEKKNVYDAMFETHKGLNRDIWFAGGVWSWLGFAPFNKMAIDILKTAMLSVRDNNISNILITCWGDNGGECSHNCALPVLYCAKCFYDGIFDMNIIKKNFKDLFEIDFDSFMLLDKINESEKNITENTKENLARTLFYNDCFLGLADTDLSNEKIVDYKIVTKQLKSQINKVGKYSYIFDALASLSSFLEVKTDLGIITRKLYKNNDRQGLLNLIKSYSLAIKRLNVFYKKYKNLWFIENKPFGWEVQDIRIGGLMQRMKYCKKCLTDYCNGSIDKIPELEETILPYANHLRRYAYTGIVSRGRI